MMKHTAGPWVYDGRNGCLAVYPESLSSQQTNCLFGAESWAIHYKNGYKDSQDRWALYPDDIANAKLIAAAPDLLEACKVVASTIEHHPDFINLDGTKLEKAWDILEAAIAKATEDDTR